MSIELIASCHIEKPGRCEAYTACALNSAL